MYDCADDLIILPPTLYAKELLHATQKILDICERYAKEYNVMINASKRKLIMQSQQRKVSDLPQSTVFMNDCTDVVKTDIHSGHFIGNVSNNDLEARITYDFQIRI